VKTKLAISAAALTLVIVHNLFPTLKADTATLVFLVLMLLPWFAGVVKSVELPGGFKIELPEVKKAAAKVLAGRRIVGEEARVTVVGAEAHVTAGGSIKAEGVIGTTAEQTAQRLQEVAAKDPNLALVGARLEIEKRLLDIAAQRGVDLSRRSAGVLFQQLQQMGAVPSDVATGLRELIALGNQAAHGASVAPAAAAWVLDALPDILSTLDRLGQAQGTESST